MIDLATRLAVGFLPVLLFLACLIYLDSYKLVGLRQVLLVILAGCAVAGIGYAINLRLSLRLGLELSAYSRYIAPAVEELLKALVLAYLIRSHRVGFLVDAAIFGFSVGAGFAVVENLYYLKLLEDSRLIVWIIRGFGTAIMHGGTIAIFGIVSKALAERNPGRGYLNFVPGLLVAVVLHSFFNHFFLSPVLSTMIVVLLLPLLIVLVFRRSERALSDWLGGGFDADVELLDLINSGRFSESKAGAYLQSLTEKFRGVVVADMLCYLRLHTELSLRAKGELMMRESGFKSEIEPDIQARFEEMKYLEGSIGKTGRLAMTPFLHVSSKGLWQLYMLGRK